MKQILRPGAWVLVSSEVWRVSQVQRHPRTKSIRLVVENPVRKLSSAIALNDVTVISFGIDRSRPAVHDDNLESILIAIANWPVEYPHEFACWLQELDDLASIWQHLPEISLAKVARICRTALDRSGLRVGDRVQYRGRSPMYKFLQGQVLTVKGTSLHPFWVTVSVPNGHDQTVPIVDLRRISRHVPG